MNELTHLSPGGTIRMVDVGDKPVTVRRARASARVRMQPATQDLIRQGGMPKGNVLETARLAGILAAKQTATLIPLCHNIPLDHVELRFAFPDAQSVAIEAEARATARTGVEMESLVAASVAALTIYDMCKSADRGIVIEYVRLEEKSGGRSGHYLRESSGVVG